MTWLLVIVFLQLVPGFERVTPIEKYKTHEECNAVLQGVIDGMKVSYPDEYNVTFTVECRVAGL